MIIYAATGPTGKQYVGQTIATLRSRRKHHLSPSSSQSNGYLDRAIQKHGSENFTWKEVEKCSSMDELNEREVFWIKQLNTLAPNGYNLMTGGKNSLHTEETKRKISKATKGRKMSDETKRKMSEACKDKKLTAEHRKKIGEAETGKKNHNFGKKLAEKTRRKISEARKGMVFSEETKRKMSVALFKRWGDPEWKAKELARRRA